MRNPSFGSPTKILLRMSSANKFISSETDETHTVLITHIGITSLDGVREILSKHREVLSSWKQNPPTQAELEEEIEIIRRLENFIEGFNENYEELLVELNLLKTQLKELKGSHELLQKDLLRETTNRKKLEREVKEHYYLVKVI